MIDGVKIAFYCVRMEEILSSLNILISERKIDGTGILRWSKATHRHLHFKIYPNGRVEIKGSLHKYWKLENHSDFSFQELRECILDLCQNFKINPLQARINNLEFAVNIRPSYNPFSFCDHVIGYLDGLKPFKEMDDCIPVIGFMCQRSEYTVKVYDKGLQYKDELKQIYDKSFNVLRFEKAVNRMRSIQQAGIKNLSDLTERAKIEKLGQILNKTFADLIIGDQINIDDLPPKELAIYNRCNNVKAWGKMKRWERVRFKPEFRRIIDTYGKNQWIAPTAKMIDEKWRMLLVINSQTTNVLPATINPVKKNDCKRSPAFVKAGECNTLTSHSQRFCKTCGRDISSQSLKSVFCSAKFVGEQQAHQCRNADSNPRNNFRNREKKFYGGAKLNLFEVNQLLQ